jgi:hypothetical protein
MSDSDYNYQIFNRIYDHLKDIYDNDLNYNPSESVLLDNTNASDIHYRVIKCKLLNNFLSQLKQVIYGNADAIANLIYQNKIRNIINAQEDFQEEMQEEMQEEEEEEEEDYQHENEISQEQSQLQLAVPPDVSSSAEKVESVFEELPATYEEALSSDKDNERELNESQVNDSEAKKSERNESQVYQPEVNSVDKKIKYVWLKHVLSRKSNVNLSSSDCIILYKIDKTLYKLTPIEEDESKCQDMEICATIAYRDIIRKRLNQSFNSDKSRVMKISQSKANNIKLNNLRLSNSKNSKFNKTRKIDSNVTTNSYYQQLLSKRDQKKQKSNSKKKSELGNIQINKNWHPITITNNTNSNNNTNTNNNNNKHNYYNN